MLSAQTLLNEWLHEQGYGTTLTLGGRLYAHFDKFVGFAQFDFKENGEILLICKRYYGYHGWHWDLPYDNTFELSLISKDALDKIQWILQRHIFDFIDLNKAKVYRVI